MFFLKQRHFKSCILRLLVTSGIIFTVSPHKNIKKTTVNDAQAENEIGADGKTG